MGRRRREGWGGERREGHNVPGTKRPAVITVKSGWWLMNSPEPSLNHSQSSPWLATIWHCLVVAQ